MPGWHEQLKDHKDVVQLGLIQEQHPDRCKLFMQWKQMDWPIMVDSLNLLGVKVVPITLFIDEHGIIRKVKPKHEDLAAFLKAEHAAPEKPTPSVSKPDPTQVKRAIDELTEAALAKPVSAAALRDAGDQAYLWLTEESAATAAVLYRSALLIGGDTPDGEAQFRTGVAVRRQFDEGDGDSELFAEAVSRWERSLEIDPNHYIRRRRIQQYGPRLDKPYSFYDWINEARTDIKARNEVPVALSAEPTGAEFAYPEKDMQEDVAAASPDPDGKINRDESGLIKVSAVPVPGKLQAGVASRVHVSFQVNAELKAHWNNESGEGQFWIDAPQGWSIEKRLWPLPHGPGATSIEQRKLEFEVRAPKDAKPGKHTLKCYALYYVCEGADGTCLYLRQDISITLEVS